MKIGYARVSTNKQNLDIQIEALQVAGCEKIFQEKASGALESREEFLKVMDIVRPGDVIIVYKLSRFARSMRQMLDRAAEMQTRGVDFHSLTENIDTSTPQGRLFFNIMAAFNEFERELIHENIVNGLRVARSGGRLGGRPRAMTQDKMKMARTMIMNPREYPYIKNIYTALGMTALTFRKSFSMEDIHRIRSELPHIKPIEKISRLLRP
jgi:DNA invertase Pin-like site-specific DNA recombinase